MNPSSGPPNPYRRNVLALDGGGVRGLSSLLILQDLMQRINLNIADARPSAETHHPVRPHDVFDFVAGTSTGGLIAIMLGKLGMTLEECIRTYHDLSRTIFRKKHFRGKITHGLAPTRYSGACLRVCIRDLVQSKGFSDNLPMVSHDGSDNMACAVVCREHYHQSKYSDFKPGAICICSLPCQNSLACLVCDAARATSAALTFFPVQNIDGRSFVDGGMEHNNPSKAIFDHYTEYDRVAGSRRVSGVVDAASPVTRHGNLDFSQVRFVNLGTGTKPNTLPPRRRDTLANFVPGFIRMGVFLKRTLTEFAVNSENIADHMETLAYVSKHSPTLNIKYERFSADNGVCYVKLDSYRDLERIEKLTLQYLEKPETQIKLKRVAEEIAREYLQKYRTATVPTTSDGRLAVPQHNAPAPNTPTYLSDDPERSAHNGPSREPSTRAADPDMSSAPVILSGQTTGIVLPAGSMDDTS